MVSPVRHLLCTHPDGVRGPPSAAVRSGGKILGEFELDGIAAARAGVPQIEVNFVLSNDKYALARAL